MRKQSKSSKQAKSLRVKVDANAVKALRPLSNEEAFRFYENVDKPTGETASSLREFLERIERVNMESIIFHTQRDDFKNWVENTLGDSKLAKRLAKMSGAPDDKLRAKMCSAIKKRLKELGETPEVASVSVYMPEVIKV
jgi:uncharacterized protein (UPF0335 family)